MEQAVTLRENRLKQLRNALTGRQDNFRAVLMAEKYQLKVASTKQHLGQLLLHIGSEGSSALIESCVPPISVIGDSLHTHSSSK